MSSIAIRNLDKRKRLKYNITEYNGVQRNIVKSDICIPFAIRASITSHSNTLNSISSIGNRCVLSGRKSGTYKDFKITRMIFKSLASSGLLGGIRKSSW